MIDRRAERNGDVAPVVRGGGGSVAAARVVESVYFRFL